MTTDKRLERVEGQLARVRWYNRCLIGGVVLSLGAWFILKTFGPETAWAQSGTKEMRANSFILEDENGKTRAELSIEKGGPHLWLYDEKGTVRSRVGLREGGPAFVLSDETGKIRASLMVTKEGPRLSLLDENSKPIWKVP